MRFAPHVESSISAKRYEPSVPLGALSTLVRANDKWRKASNRRVRVSAPCATSSLTIRLLGFCSGKSRPAAWMTRKFVALCWSSWMFGNNTWS